MSLVQTQVSKVTSNAAARSCPQPWSLPTCPPTRDVSPRVQELEGPCGFSRSSFLSNSLQPHEL